MLKRKFFIFLVLTLALVWLGFSRTFSKWADRAQADAEGLAQQAARAVSASLPTSPYASVARSASLKKTLAALPANTGRAGRQELVERLSDTFPEWGTEDIALLVDKASGKAWWWIATEWTDKAPAGYSKQVIQNAAARKEMVELGNGLKLFVAIEVPADSAQSMWIGGPAMRSWETTLEQELKRTEALGIGIVVSNKPVIQRGQRASLSAAISSIPPGKAGALKSEGGSLVSTFWGTSKPRANEVAARQPLSIDTAELLVVLGNPTAQALHSAQQLVFYGWMALLLAGLVVGFVAFAEPPPVRRKEAPRRREPALSPPSSPPAPAPEVPSSPPAPSLASAPAPSPAFPLVPDAPLEVSTAKEAGAPEVRFEKKAQGIAEQAFALPSSPSLPVVSSSPSLPVVPSSPSLPVVPSSPSLPVVPSSPSLTPLPSAPFLAEEASEALTETGAPQIEELISKMPPPSPFFAVDDSKALQGIVSQAQERTAAAFAQEPFFTQRSEPLHAQPPAAFTFADSVPEEPMPLGLHGKPVHPEELLGIDHAPNENPADVFEATLREEAERFLGADFLPEQASLAGEVLSASAEGPEVASWRNVFAEFLRVRKQCNQETESLTFERFKTKLEASKSNLLSKHSCKTVRFLVQIKEGKAAIKAIPVRD